MHIFLFFLALLLLPIATFGQTVYFKADGESGAVVPPWDEVYYKTTAINSTAVKKNGTRSFKFTNAGGENDGKVIIYGSGRARRLEAYYSAWYYIAAGYNDNKWRNNMQWKTDNDAQFTTIPGTVKMVLGFEVRNGVRQVVLGIKNAKASYPGQQVKPIPIPLKKWFHLEAYVKVANYPNGIIRVWQDGQQIFDVTGVNTLTTLAKDGSGRQSDNDYLYYGIGSYIDPVAATDFGEQTVYADDTMITNYRVFPTLQTATLTAPTNLRIVGN